MPNVFFWNLGIAAPDANVENEAGTTWAWFLFVVVNPCLLCVVTVQFGWWNSFPFLFDIPLKGLFPLYIVLCDAPLIFNGRKVWTAERLDFYDKATLLSHAECGLALSCGKRLVACFSQTFMYLFSNNGVFRDVQMSKGTIIPPYHHRCLLVNLTVRVVLFIFDPEDTASILLSGFIVSENVGQKLSSMDVKCSWTSPAMLIYHVDVQLAISVLMWQLLSCFQAFNHYCGT